MKTFDFANETLKAENYEFRGRQHERFVQNGCELVMEWRYMAGDVSHLPMYVKKSISENGYEPVYIGGTTYVSTVIGLRKKIQG